NLRVYSAPGSVTSGLLLNTKDTAALRDIRVRRALNHAVDRAALLKDLYQGRGRLCNGVVASRVQYAIDPGAYPYDPDKARALLAEAGFANGFDTEIVNGNLLTSWTGAIQGYLGAVGIRAKVTTLQAVAGITRAESGDAPLYMSSWGSYSVNDVSAFLPYFFTGSSDDFAQDPEVKALLIQGGSVNDPDTRKAAYSKAIHRLTDQAYMIPIATFTTTYGVSKQLNFKPWADEMPRWYLSSWK
ncbi:MAG: ABC transporter substrate-binding protein, partial [Nevskiales bacterium]